MGKIKMSINTLLGENQTYFAGTTVEGEVIIDLKEPKAIRGRLRIVLTGVAQVKWEELSAIRSDIQTIFDNMTMYLWGTDSDTEAILTAGKHKFPYVFQLPANIPSSHEDFNGYIRYTLIAILPAKVLEVISQKIINVHEIVRIKTPELINPLFDFNAKSLCCLCCTSAPIELSVTINKGGYNCGEIIVIKESHRYRRITSVCATLMRKTTYHIRGTGQSKFSYKRIAATHLFINAVRTPGVKAGYLHIPLTVPSITFGILNVTYFLNVTLAFKLPMVKKLTVSIPITIGNVRRSTESSQITSSISSAPVQPMQGAVPRAPISNAVHSFSLGVPSTTELGVPITPPPPYSEYAIYPSVGDPAYS